MSLTRPRHARVFARVQKPGHSVYDVITHFEAHAYVLGRVLHTVETHGRVSTRVFTTMHTDLKF